MQEQSAILGAGVTGLAAGWASGLPVYEATELPGGICSSYYMRAGASGRSHGAPEDDEAYRYEIGGGHWIFGGDPTTLDFIRRLTPARSYERRSSVFFPDRELYVPYPLQNHLSHLGKGIASKALTEIVSAPAGRPRTMADWLYQSFGATLVEEFFGPFHQLYTAGLWEKIAPQDGYKSPVDVRLAIQGAFEDSPAVGYNVTFLYPGEGLNTLACKMAQRNEVRFRRRVAHVNVNTREAQFTDGSGFRYHSLVSTLPLSQMIQLCDLTPDETPDPYTSVLVLNIGAKRGRSCPNDHWIYVPSSASGFHRVGFYSNVDPSFIPRSARASGDRVSIYVERAYKGGERPAEAHVQNYCRQVVQELQQWRFIEEVDAIDPTWIECAYTWSLPGSRWKQKALAALEQHRIMMVGRYARWNFQGIADSLRDGFYAGAALKA